MGNALFGGILIGVFVKGWLGVFVLPVFVAIYQCISLFYLVKRNGFNRKKFKSDYEEFQQKYNGISIEKFSGSGNIYIIQFGWTYITTTLFAVIVHFVKVFIW